ncbi:MAG TPA: hypothetical protein VK509_01060 [Polyangiales bacterium]|nr:hypothetical protein [Polyangiales bacterium]
MNDRTRLRDGSDAHMRELLRYAQTQDRPSPASVDALTARVLAELAQPAASPSQCPSPSEPAAMSGSASAAGWLSAASSRWIAGITAALVLGLGAYRLIAPTAERRELPAATAPRSSATAPAVAPAVTRTVQSPASAATPPSAVAPQSEPERDPTRPRPRRAKPADVQAVRSDPAAEVALLQRARRAVVGEPRAALALVAEHGRVFPQGMFAEEREALAVEALWRSGLREQAASRLRALLARYPRSSYRERLSALLADTRD